jgi:hypothetical protein
MSRVGREEWCCVVKKMSAVLCERESFCRTEATGRGGSGRAQTRKEERLEGKGELMAAVPCPASLPRRRAYRCHHTLLPCSAPHHHLHRRLYRSTVRARVCLRTAVSVSCRCAHHRLARLASLGLHLHRHRRPHRPGFASLAATPRLTSCPIHRILSALRANRI